MEPNEALYIVLRFAKDQSEGLAVFERSELSEENRRLLKAIDTLSTCQNSGLWSIQMTY